MNWEGGRDKIQAISDTSSISYLSDDIINLTQNSNIANFNLKVQQRLFFADISLYLFFHRLLTFLKLYKN